MASKKCSTCLRLVQRQTRIASFAPRYTQSRPFRATAARCVEVPGRVESSPSTSVPIPTPVTQGGKPELDQEKMHQQFVDALKKPGGYLETYPVYGATDVLYQECARQADYLLDREKLGDEEIPKTADGEDLGVGEAPWHKEIGLPATFSTWSQITMLHIYLLVVRIRCLPAVSSQLWQQHLVNHFFYDAEHKMVINHDMQARGTRNKYLKDLFLQWRGLVASYDEGLAKSDAVLASAVWRNVFKASEEVDVRHVALIVAYMRSTVQMLDSAPDGVLFRVDKFTFPPLSQQKTLTGLRSKEMDQSFVNAAAHNSPAKSTQASKTR